MKSTHVLPTPTVHKQTHTKYHSQEAMMSVMNVKRQNKISGLLKNVKQGMDLTEIHSKITTEITHHINESKNKTNSVVNMNNFLDFHTVKKNPTFNKDVANAILSLHLTKSKDDKDGLTLFLKKKNNSEYVNVLY